MNKEQAVKYLSFSGFSDEQIRAITDRDIMRRMLEVEPTFEETEGSGE